MITEIEILVAPNVEQIAINVNGERVTLDDVNDVHPYVAQRLWDIMTYFQKSNKTAPVREFNLNEDF